MKYNYVFFDVANTLLYKKDLYEKIIGTLSKFDMRVERNSLIQKHTLISEIIVFPQKTSEEFYHEFNSQLLYILGIIPTEEILDALYKNCACLQWEKFSDTDILSDLSVKFGVISNWDKSLSEKLKKFFNFEFQPVLYSSAVGIAKPDIKIFKKAILQSKVPLDKILYVGNSIKLDIEPALLAGIQPLLIDRDSLYPYFKGKKIKSLFEIKEIIDD